MNEGKPILNLKQKLKSAIQSVGLAVKKRSKKMLRWLENKEKLGQVPVVKKGLLNNAVRNPRGCKVDKSPR